MKRLTFVFEGTIRSIPKIRNAAIRTFLEEVRDFQKRGTMQMEDPNREGETLQFSFYQYSKRGETHVILNNLK